MEGGEVVLIDCNYSSLVPPFFDAPITEVYHGFKGGLNTRVVFDLPIILFFEDQSLEHIPGAPCDAVGEPVLDEEHDVLPTFQSVLHERGESFQFHRDRLYQVGRLVSLRHCEGKDMGYTPVD